MLIFHVLAYIDEIRSCRTWWRKKPITFDVLRNSGTEFSFLGISYLLYTTCSILSNYLDESGVAESFHRRIGSAAGHSSKMSVPDRRSPPSRHLISQYSAEYPRPVQGAGDSARPDTAEFPCWQAVDAEGVHDWEAWAAAH
jgi:hypothetical protein